MTRVIQMIIKTFKTAEEIGIAVAEIFTKQVKKQLFCLFIMEIMMRKWGLTFFVVVNFQNYGNIVLSIF